MESSLLTLFILFFLSSKIKLPFSVSLWVDSSISVPDIGTLSALDKPWWPPVVKKGIPPPIAERVLATSCCPFKMVAEVIFTGVLQSVLFFKRPCYRSVELF